MAMSNPTAYYPDFVIKDISASLAQVSTTLPQTPILFTIDGPMSLRNQSYPYTLTVSKLKDK
jgi:hypothetical protein